MRLFMAIAVLLTATPASAAELLSVDVAHDDGTYTMTSVTWFDAPRLGVFDVLTDYSNFGAISSVYTDSRFESPAEDGTPRVFTQVEGCVLFFCQTMERLERLENRADDYIRTVVEPNNSDFHHSEATWQLTDERGGTRVVYQVIMKPAFWVPPVIGPYMMKRKLAKGGEDAIQRIERLANASDANADSLRARGLSGFETP
ncbi:MAG: SRPBCC family protein [Pseudomonadota bacterium]